MREIVQYINVLLNEGERLSEAEFIITVNIDDHYSKLK